MENNEVALANNQGSSLITPETINSYMKAFGIASELNDAERSQFITVACAFQLNPFKREIYCVPYKVYKQGRETGEKKLSIIVGYETYLKRAEKSGQLSGWKVWTESSPSRAIIEITRKDWKSVFRHEVFLDEYKQQNKMWDSKPFTMLKKVCIAQGFRLCFPCECGGMPYTSDELPITNEQHEKIAEIDKKSEPIVQAEAVIEEVQKEVKKMESTFDKALAIIPKAKTQEALTAIQTRLDERFSEGLLTLEQMGMIKSKIDEQAMLIAESLVKESFK